MFREPPRACTSLAKDIAEYQVITPTQLAVVGEKVGTAMLNLWFADPAAANDPTKDHLLSYLIVVLPDPQATLLERKRLEAEVKAYEASLKVLEKEIKRAFPDSAVELSMVGEKVVVGGEVKDTVEAAQILRSSTNTRRSMPARAFSRKICESSSFRAWAIRRPRSLRFATCCKGTRIWSTSFMFRVSNR